MDAGVEHGSSLTFAELVERGSVIVLLLCALWLAAVVVALSVELASHGRVPALRLAGLSPVMRRRVLMACGVALAAGATSAPSSYAAGPGDPSAPDVHARTVVLDAPTAWGRGAASDSTLDRPLDRPLGGAWTAGPSSSSSAAPSTVTVRPGDSLWSLARAHLGPVATTAQVDAAWRALHAANRSVVGPDPDLIHPGQQLRWPDDTETSERRRP